MSSFTILIIEILICISISLLFITLLRALLLNQLTEVCGNNTRARFWLTFTQLMMIIFPLLIVIYHAPVSSPQIFEFASELKNILFRTLLGDFMTLLTVGWAMFKSIKNSDAHHASTGSTTIENTQ